MPDVFISYSTQDQPLANFMHKHLIDEGIQTFMAASSLEVGQQWSSEIIQNLKDSKWVLLLASKAACKSNYVNQEIGGTVVAEKKLVPIVWDMPPENLPGWAKEYQALNLANATPETVRLQISQIAAKIKTDKFVGYAIGGLLLAGLAIVIAKS